MVNQFLGRCMLWLRDGKAKALPQRRIMVLSNGAMTYHVVSSRRQVMAVAIAACSGFWVLVATIGLFVALDVSEKRHAEALKTKLSYGRLVNRVEITQHRFAEITRDIQQSHVELLALNKQNEQLRTTLETVESKLHQTENEKQRFHALSSAMRNQFSLLQDHARRFSDSNLVLLGELDEVQRNAADLARERNIALEDLADTREQLTLAEQRIDHLNAAKSYALNRMSDYTVSTIEEIESVLAMTEIPVDRLLFSDEELLAKGLAPPAVGGPFISDLPGRDDPVFHNAALTVNNALNSLDDSLNRLTRLQLSLKHLPLATPLDNYYLSSRFGRRKDPFNGRWAMHKGVDMAGPKKTPIYSSATGRVIRAGKTAEYGNMVELDHGNGITSLYAHLYRISVKKGDEVGYRDRVGLMGSTGRSTGNHLHYEIRIDGKAVDPMNFIEAGRHVFKEK